MDCKQAFVSGELSARVHEFAMCRIKMEAARADTSHKQPQNTTPSQQHNVTFGASAQARPSNAHPASPRILFAVRLVRSPTCLFSLVFSR
jgi:hypothetical protein